MYDRDVDDDDDDDIDNDNSAIPKMNASSLLLFNVFFHFADWLLFFILNLLTFFHSLLYYFISPLLLHPICLNCMSGTRPENPCPPTDDFLFFPQSYAVCCLVVLQV